MSNFNDYSEYRKRKPDYKNWKNEREQKLANKLQYIKTNPVDKDEFNKDVERAKVVLSAVNIMDEYSQSRAEEMEQISEGVVAAASEPIAIASMGLAGLALKLSNVKLDDLQKALDGDKKLLKRCIPAGIAYITPSLIFSALGAIWAAKNEIKASREGRQEAMANDLVSVKQFAVLDVNQQKQVDKIAKGINVSKKDSKKIIQKSNKLGAISAIKTIFKKDNSEKYLANVKINEGQLTPEQILEAKKDKDLVQNIVEKIDIASQDYAEDTENAINIFSTLASTGGVATGFLTRFITGKFKNLAKHKNLIGYLIGGGITLGAVFYGAKMQKQASRVARFKVKQELLNNPEQLMYIDEDKYKNENAPRTENKKQGFFKNIAKIISDNKEYNQYIKEQNAQNIKIMKAKEQIELTPEQEQRAHQLQQNVFNMFNKLDEKSQRYSEAAEAMGAITQTGVSMLLTLPGALGSMFLAIKGKSNLTKYLGIAGYIVSLLSTIGISFMITKDQKNASRVANMEAIKELDDYSYFASNEASKKDINKQQNMQSSNKNLSPFLQKMLNK